MDVNFHLDEGGYFGFDTENDMIANTLRITDNSTGNMLELIAGKVSADNLWVDWDIELDQDPVEVN